MCSMFITVPPMNYLKILRAETIGVCEITVATP